MLVKKQWVNAHKRYSYLGWFLFGIIPLYIIRVKF